MDHVERLKNLKKSIVDVIEKLQEYPKASVISGNGEERLCEASIVEEMVLALFRNAGKDNMVIGREVLYPHPKWKDNKLDIGLEFIEGSKYLFKIAIEVKKWIGIIDPNELGWVPQNIWHDIFKITGYQDDEDHQEAGLNKFVLFYFETIKTSYKNVLVTLEKTFITQEYLKDYLNKNGRTVATFIENYLGWSTGIDTALHYFGLKGEEQELRSGLIELEPITDSDKVIYCPKRNIGAALLKINRAIGS